MTDKSIIQERLEQKEAREIVGHAFRYLHNLRDGWGWRTREYSDLSEATSILGRILNNWDSL